MSMMPRLWVLYITEVFVKYRNHDFSPTELLRKLWACFTFSAKMFLMFCVKKPNGFISKSNEKPHKPARRSYSQACACLITEGQFDTDYPLLWIEESKRRNSKKNNLPWPVPSWAGSNRDKAPQTSPSSAYDSTASHPSRSTSWSGGHSTPNTWEGKDRPRAWSRVTSGDKTNTFHCSSFVLLRQEKLGCSSRQSLADSVSVCVLKCFFAIFLFCRYELIPLFQNKYKYLHFGTHRY